MLQLSEWERRQGEVDTAGRPLSLSGVGERTNGAAAGRFVGSVWVGEAGSGWGDPGSGETPGSWRVRL